MEQTVFDVAVIGAGPAGTQAAVSASHQMRHVLILDGGAVSNLKGRAFWSKSVPIEDAPVFPGATGPEFIKALRAWVASRPVMEYALGGAPRLAGIDMVGGLVKELRAQGEIFELLVSTLPLKPGLPPTLKTFLSRTVVVASGFDDRWPDIEMEDGERLLSRYRSVFRYAGNRRGWHVCIRCDGHLHVGGHMALLGQGETIYEAALGAQDFASRLTILTNGRPHLLPPEAWAQAGERGIDIVETRITTHIGKGTELLGLGFEDGTKRYFDGFLVDEGLEPNTDFLKGWEVARDGDGLLKVDEDGALLTPSGAPVPGLFAAGDIVSGERNLIATAFALGQNAGLSASDSLRQWHWPGE